jgi:hypothetical protein
MRAKCDRVSPRFGLGRGDQVTVCSVLECSRKVYARGWCSRHYQRWLRTGTARPPSTDERFWAKVERSDGCWLWTAALDGGGYGVFKVRGILTRAHRHAYEVTVGPIPEGLELDHRCHSDDLSCISWEECRHRRCVNPSHLEPVTHQVNNNRGRGPSAISSRKTHCVRGHPLAGGNVKITRQGFRTCLACVRIRSRRRYRPEATAP